MAIGTSLGAYFDDEFHHQAGINTDPSQDHIDVDPEVDDQSTKPKPKLDIMKVSDTSPAPDYDMDAWQKANPGVQMAPGQHYPDTYKFPNHMTFSDESIYHGGDNQGGHWGLEDGKDTFTPGPTNLANHSLEEMKDYFKRVEPDVKLILPDTAAGMASGASEKAVDALKSSRGTLPSLDSDTGIKGDVIVPASETARKLGIDTAITSEDRDTATSIAMAASGGGLSVKGGGVKILQGIPQIGRKPANQNLPDLYNPRDPSMIGSHELDADMDAAWKSMGDKHARLDAIRQERNGINKVREDRDWSDIDLAKYNKLGAEANKLMGEDFFSKVDVKLKKYMTQEELDKMVDELAASRAEQSKSIDDIK